MEPSELLDMLKDSTGAPSDYAVASILDCRRSTVSTWRRNASFPDEEMCIKIAALTGTAPAAILIYAAMWRAKTKVARKHWEQMLESVPEQKH